MPLPSSRASVREYQWLASSMRGMSGPTASRTAAQAAISILTEGAQETGGIQVWSLMAVYPRLMSHSAKRP